MLKKIKREINAFERYFLYEAEGDDEDGVEVTVAPRANRGTDYTRDDTTNEGQSVTVAPRSNRGTDYTAEDDTPEETQDTPEENEDTGEENQDEPEEGDNQEETPDEGGEDTGNEDPPEEEPEATDYTDDGGDDEGGGEDNAEGEGNEEGNEEENNEESEEEKDEKLKKFHMYHKYMKLYNTLETFTERMRNTVKPSVIENIVIKTAHNNLSDIRENMYDFMTIRYEKASYVEVLIYFETALSAIRLNFELLRNNKINLKQ